MPDTSDPLLFGTWLPVMLQKLYSTLKITVQLLLRRRQTPHVEYHGVCPYSDAHGHEGRF
jgi:hypothetical protein